MACASRLAWTLVLMPDMTNAVCQPFRSPTTCIHTHTSADCNVVKMMLPQHPEEQPSSTYDRRWAINIPYWHRLLLRCCPHMQSLSPVYKACSAQITVADGHRPGLGLYQIESIADH